MITLTASKQQHARQFSEEIFKSGDRFRQDRVDGAILDILRNQARGRHDREERRENAHRAESDIFQDLKFLLEGQLRHEDRVADQEQGKKKQDVKSLQAGQLGKRVRGDRRDSSEEKKRGGRIYSSGFGPLVSSGDLVASRKSRSSEVRDRLCSINARARLCGQCFDFAEQLGRSIFENEVGLIFNREQIAQRAFADEDPVGQNAHAIANLLDLPEQMRRKEHRYAASLEIENEIADFPRAGRIDSGGRFVQDDELRLLDERLREADALQHSLGVTAQPAIPRTRQANQIEQFFDATPQARAAQSAKFPIEAERLAAGEIFVEVRTLRQETDGFAALDQIAVPAENLVLPRVGETRPRMILSVVLLPDPFGPSSP